MTSTECDLSDGQSGRMFRTAGEEWVNEEGGGQHRARCHRGEREDSVGEGEAKLREARSCLLTTYFNPLNRLPSAPAFSFFFFCLLTSS